MSNFTKSLIIEAFLKAKKRQLTREQLVLYFDLTQPTYRLRQLSHFLLKLRAAGILELVQYDVFRIIDVAGAEKTRDAFKKQELLELSSRKPVREKRAVNITDRYMLELPGILKAKNIIHLAQEFWDAIDIKKENISNIKSGYQRFQVSHLQNAYEKYGVNPNWIFGVEDRIFLIPRRLKTVTKTVTKKSKNQDILKKEKK